MLKPKKIFRKTSKLSSLKTKPKISETLKKIIKKPPTAIDKEDRKKLPSIKKVMKKATEPLKRFKKCRNDDKSNDRNVVKKRMASLNASAILAASYEIENYTAKHYSDESNSEIESDVENESTRSQTLPKREKKDVKIETEEVKNLQDLSIIFRI